MLRRFRLQAVCSGLSSKVQNNFEFMVYAFGALGGVRCRAPTRAWPGTKSKACCSSKLGFRAQESP